MSCKHHIVFSGSMFGDGVWMCRRCLVKEEVNHIHPTFAGISYYGMAHRRCKLCGKEYIWKMYINHGELRIEMWWDEDRKKFLIRNSVKEFDNAMDAIHYIVEGEYEKECGREEKE